jgi:CBS domain containing-hemolysin-like protein
MLAVEGTLLVLLVCCSAFFSSVETAFVSLSEIRVQHLLENGKKGVALVKRLRDNYQRLIITILIGNNLVNIGASSIATSMAIKVYGDTGVGIAVGVMTFVILVFGEITPKTVAMAHNEWLAITAAPLVRAIQFPFFPAILLMEWITAALARPMRNKDCHPVITEAEIKSVVSLGEEIGEVEEDERIMIHNIFRFSDLEVYEIMTDRTRIFSVNADRTVDEVAPEIVKQGYSRVPVFKEVPDRMVGVLHAKDVLHAAISGRGGAAVSGIARPPMFVPETMLLDDLLKLFQQRKTHLSLVVDEHGGVSGLVTIEDLLEEIVGEIYDEMDTDPPLIRKVDKTRSLVRGETEVEEVNRHLKLGIDEHEDYETISGFILQRLRYIPQVGEEVRLGGAVIRVTKADPQHIIEVEIEKAPPPAREEGQEEGKKDGKE